MRIFIGFKWQAGDGTQTTVPVTYGDMSRQVATLIKENSENKMLSVPRIACYIGGLELDMSRISDATFVSKVNVRQKSYDVNDGGDVEWQNYQGGSYTVERLMPTPFKLSVKADIWTSSIDQKLQLFEQIMVLFNPSLEIQTTDNYIDWTSLSVVEIQNINFHFESKIIFFGANKAANSIVSVSNLNDEQDKESKDRNILVVLVLEGKGQSNTDWDLSTDDTISTIKVGRFFVVMH
jgi:hypothetical protein